MENIEYQEKVKYRIWELMRSQNYDTLDQLCQDTMGCFPDLIYENLGDEIRKEFSAQKTNLHLSEYSLPEPNLADYEWRFTRQSVEDLINQYEIHKESSVALLGVPTLFFYLEKFEKNVTLYDINELFSEKNLPNIITIDLSRNEIPTDQKYDCVIMDPPWYMTDYRNWIYHASHILNKGGRLITTLFQPLLRPDAETERNQILEEGIPIAFTLHDFWLMCPRGQFLQRSLDEKGLRKLCDGQENSKCATNCYSQYFTGRSNSIGEDIDYWSYWINERMEESLNIISKCNSFISPSRYLMKRFIEEFQVPQDKIQYLDYGFPLHYLTPFFKKANRDVFTFGYIGTHIPAKGVNLLINAFHKLGSNVRLLIWGRQSDPYLTELVKQDSGRIKFMGEYVNHNLADEVFSKIDAIVVPSIWGENSPLVIHEAQACRVPVITADFGGMAEYVQHQVNGLLFTHRDENSLQGQLQWAIDHPEEMKTFGQRGYLYEKNGNVPGIEEHCEKLINIYNQAINQHAKTLAHNA